MRFYSKDTIKPNISRLKISNNLDEKLKQKISKVDEKFTIKENLPFFRKTLSAIKLFILCAKENYFLNEFELFLLTNFSPWPGIKSTFANYIRTSGNGWRTFFESSSQSYQSYQSLQQTALNSNYDRLWKQILWCQMFWNSRRENCIPNKRLLWA